MRKWFIEKKIKWNSEQTRNAHENPCKQNQELAKKFSEHAHERSAQEQSISHPILQ
jgi:hypothetical protein